MGTVCEVCGDIGLEHLMLCCSDCKGSATHQYCLDKVLFDASLVDCWLCDDCKQRHGEVTCSGSIDEVSSKRQQCHAHFDSTANQPVIKRSGSARDDAVAGRIGKGKPHKKFKSLNKLYSPEKNSPRKKGTKKKSTVRPMGNCTNRKGPNATSGKVLHSCETMRTETSKSNNGENWQVNNERSDHTRNNVKQPSPLIVNCLGYKLGDIDLTKMRRRRKLKKTSQSVIALPEGFVVMEKNDILGSKNVEPSSPTSGSGNSVNERRRDKPNCMDSGADSSLIPSDHDDLINHSAPVGCKNAKVNSVVVNKTSVGAHQNKYQETAQLMNNKCKVHDDNNNVIDELALETEDEEVRSQQDCRASTELQQRIIAANVTQPSSLQTAIVDKVMPYSPNMGMLSKENYCTSSEHIEIQNQIEYQSEPSKLLDPAKFVLADSATEKEISDVLQNFSKNNRRKRRKLILLYDDADENEEEKVVHVQLGNANSRPFKYDGLTTNHRVDTECYTEPAVLTGDFSNQSPNNGRPVNKQRMGVNKDEDEEAVVGAANSDSAINDATDCALNDGTNLTSETLVANDPCLQSRMISNSESVDLYIYPQPADDPVWSGAFKVNSEVSVKMDAHLSNKACQKVREFVKSLQTEPVLEAKKLPWLRVLPKRWKSSGPPDDCIGLFFFPHSFRPNEVSNGLVTEIIESDSALKITVGVADLLIFPSTILPEQNHLYQGKHYLWGVFQRRKAMSHNGVLDREQDGSACAAEKCIQQQKKFSRQYGSACASEGELQEEHLLNQRDLEQHKCSDQEINVVKHAENQQPLVECNSETQIEAMKNSVAEGFTLPGYSLSLARPNSPIVGSTCSMLSEQANQQGGTTSSLEINAPSAAEPSAEGDHGRSHCVSEPPTTKLFGIFVAQTPRSRQLFQEMASEGALVFPVVEETVTEDYTSTRNSDGVGPGLNPDYQHLFEHSQPFDFVLTGLDEPPQPAVVACLELFPVRQEQIGLAPGAEASSMGVDLELSLSLPSRPTPVLQLKKNFAPEFLGAI
ncbi:unnamed protein product [Urochloa humidicola]